MSRSESPIPFGDLKAQYESIKNDVDEVIRDVIDKSQFVRGPYVEKFEEMFASLMDRDHCVSCANGTDALYIAMRALGVGAGDEIIAPAHSWISTTQTVTQAGGSVVFCDTDIDSYTIDPSCIEAKITSKTVGIIPVHLYGQAADMDVIMAIAEKHGLWVLEDCAQAHLARHNGRLVGTFGDAATFSFYPGKNLGAMGDAGAIVTNNQVLAEKMAMFARHGGLKKGSHLIEGVNSRLDGLQAAVLTVKMPHLQAWTKARQSRAILYGKLLGGEDSVSTPVTCRGNEHVWHLYVIKHARRDELAEFLRKVGVQTVINYPVALPFLPAYERFGHGPQDFPNAYHNQSRILSLPMYPELEDSQIERVSAAVSAFNDRS